jgi:hypothetical protein
VEQPGAPERAGRPAVPTRLMAPGPGTPGAAHARRARDEDLARGAAPLAGREAGQQGVGQPTRRPRVAVCATGPLAQCRLAKRGVRRRASSAVRSRSRSSPFFPVKVTARTRHVSGVERSRERAPALRRADPGAPHGAGHACGAAHTHSTAASPTVHCHASARQSPASLHGRHPPRGGALWSGGAPPQTPVRPAWRGGHPGEAGGAPCGDACAPRQWRLRPSGRPETSAATGPAAHVHAGALPHMAGQRAGPPPALGGPPKPGVALFASGVAS